MQFSLDEIQQLISLDKLIETAKPQAQSLVKSKLKDIDENVKFENSCGEDELIWDEVAKLGEDPWELEQPAPFIKLTPKTGTQ